MLYRITSACRFYPFLLTFVVPFSCKLTLQTPGVGLLLPLSKTNILYSSKLNSLPKVLILSTSRVLRTVLPVLLLMCSIQYSVRNARAVS